MAKSPNSFTFNLAELASLMLKEAEIHEGHWQLVANFSLGAGAFGQSEDSVFPTGFVGLQSLGLQRAEGPAPLTYDAAKLNPSN